MFRLINIADLPILLVGGSTVPITESTEGSDIGRDYANLGQVRNASSTAKLLIRVNI
jgi:hypothetical protein